MLQTVDREIFPTLEEQNHDKDQLTNVINQVE